MTTKNLDPTKPKESKLYPIVERWLRKHHHSLKEYIVEINKLYEDTKAGTNTNTMPISKRVDWFTSLLVVVSVAALFSCNNILDTGEVDPLITLEDALEQDYRFSTPVYHIQVAFRADVSADIPNVLDELDARAANFLKCQFDNPELGFEDVPLSHMRVFIVPRTFTCEAENRETCSGIYYFGEADVMILAKAPLSGCCGKYRAFKHELGHRYGMLADHSNKSEFKDCIGAPGCDIDFDTFSCFID
ncbi:MAG TPA: hypothetical protein VH878_09770 [Thermodesulfobacteriota bacterium]